MNGKGRSGVGVMLCAVCMCAVAACSLPGLVVHTDPLSAVEHERLGRIYESQNRFDLALRQYREAIGKDGKLLSSRLLLGDLSYRSGDYSGAEAAYRKALDLDPGNADVRNNLAWVYLRQGRHIDRAKELAMQALVLNPGHRPFYLDTLGVVLLRLGQVAAALAALKESVETLQGERALAAEAQGHLAEAYKAAGDDRLYRDALLRQRELQNGVNPVSSPSGT